MQNQKNTSSNVQAGLANMAKQFAGKKKPTVVVDSRESPFLFRLQINRNVPGHTPMPGKQANP